MGINIQYHRTCDRCAHPFEEASVKDPKNLPQPEDRKRLWMTYGENVVFDWEDLCPDCRKAVENLLDRLRLLGSSKKHKSEASGANGVEGKGEEQEQGPSESQPAVKKADGYPF